ncbi:MAG TPA: anaerobic glycerol-3-phosphate dehydrogenase subunit C [Baekduia sp.]|nr:anaerobic glycerol-3-phosphate dehydrogenase subunit C [Baekduia sp.]
MSGAGVEQGDLVGELTMRATLDHCVKCTICEQNCPVSAVTPLFPGPKYAGPQSERFREAGVLQVDASVDYCSGCGICTQVCPHGVAIAEINAQARAQLKRDDGIALRDRIITRSALLGKLGTPTAPLANWTLGNAPFRWLVEKLLHVHRDAPLPRFAGRRFNRKARKRARLPDARRKVVFFHGCGADYYDDHLAEMTVAVLEHNGIAVEIPKQGCCGLPMQSSGLFKDARRYVRKLAAELAPSIADGSEIVACSTSCSLMLKREAIEVLELHDDDDLLQVSRQTRDICEFLVDLHDRGELKTDFLPLDEKIAYHAPCQQQGHGIGKPAMELFRLVPGLDLTEMDARCCGIAGTYGLKREKYQIAIDVGQPLWDQIEAADPDEVACDSETCRWQITKESQRPSVHPVEVLYRAYGLS